jgi:hypothetical protein
MNQRTSAAWRNTVAMAAFAVVVGGTPARLSAAGGSLQLKVVEEDSGQPCTARLQLWRGQPAGRVMPIRRTVPAGRGVVLDRTLSMTLPDGRYAFRISRGPEYRVVSGTFALERTSSDQHTVDLPRMVNMLDHGWTSGDCCIPASRHSLPLRMAAEDLHVAAVTGHIDADPIPYRDHGEAIENEPSWIREDAVVHHGLIFYGNNPADESRLPCECLAEIAADDPNVRVAIENPFAWPLPVWLASRRISGIFVLGDWLRLDRPVTTIPHGRGPQSLISGDKRAIGYGAYDIYRHLLEAGFRVAPLAGTGTGAPGNPVGYNRLYVAGPSSSSSNDPGVASRRVGSPGAWWNAAWDGHSVLTNGPMMRATLSGRIPGHVFRIGDGGSIELRPDIHLSVRDPVDYLEVIHNGRVHYSASLDRFARDGGKIPSIRAEESGWVIIHVITQYEDHFRAAISAPWYIERRGKPRISEQAVRFFQQWLSEYEQQLQTQPGAELQRHAPFIRSARRFWSARLP